MADQPCTIGKQIVIHGKIAGNEDLVVQGNIEGEIKLGNHLQIEQTGVVEANVDVQNLTVHGIFHGDARATKSIMITSGAKAVGNIRAPQIVIEEGARFKGRIEMDVQLPADLNK